MKVFILVIFCLMYTSESYAFNAGKVARTIKNRIKWTVAYKTPSEARGIVYVLVDELLDKITPKI
jgi:hypothetical protein